MTDDLETLQEKIKALEVEVAKARFLALKDAHAAVWAERFKDYDEYVWSDDYYSGVIKSSCAIVKLIIQARNQLSFAELNRDS